MAPAHRTPCDASGQALCGCLFSIPHTATLKIVLTTSLLPRKCYHRLGRQLTRSWRHSLPFTIGMAAEDVALRTCTTHKLLWYIGAVCNKLAAPYRRRVRKLPDGPRVTQRTDS